MNQSKSIFQSQCSNCSEEKQGHVAPIDIGIRKRIIRIIGFHMRLSSLHILDFRCFADATIVFDDYTCFVGPNGAGKSTILTALNVFFRETANAATDTLTLSKEDFHLSDTSRPIKIEVTLENLDAEAQEDFKAYYRNGKLIISAVAEWNEAAQGAPVIQYGERLGIEAFRVYF